MGHNRPPSAPKEKSATERLKDSFNQAINVYCGLRGKIATQTAEILLSDGQIQISRSPVKSFELGELQTDEKIELVENKTHVLAGSVDQVRFDKNKLRNDTKWWQEICKTAERFNGLKDHITINFPSLKDRNSEKFKKMEFIADWIAINWKQNEFGAPGKLKDKFKDILGQHEYNSGGKNFKITITEEDLYGPEGAMQLLLGISRATATVDETELLHVGVDSGTPKKIFKIHVNIAPKNLHNSQQYRYGIVFSANK